MSKRKIAILITDLRGGGAERVVVNLANEFISRGYAVDVVLVKAAGVFLDELDSRIVIINLKAERLRSSLIPLVQYFKESKPDAFIANMWPLTGIAVVAAKISGYKDKLMVVEHIQWSISKNDYSKIYGWLMKLGMRWLFPLTDSVIAVSDGAADDLATVCNMPRNKISTIHNPIVNDVAFRSYLDLHVPEWITGSHRKLIAIGSFKTQKNFPLLFNAMAILSPQLNVKLLVLGEGDLRSDFETIIRKLGIEDKVFMPGFSKSPASFLELADLFVLSSDFEGFGNVIVEALNAGTPVVSTDCPSGPREILEDGKYGKLVPMGDAEVLAKTMLESLMESHDREALKRRAKDFTIAKAVDKYLSLIFEDIQNYKSLGASNYE